MKRTRSFRTAIVAGAALIGLALPATAHAAKHWAVVASNGTLQRGKGVATVSRPEAGTYIVTFTANVHRCAYVATPGDPSTGFVTTPAVASASSRVGNPRAVSVHMFDEQTSALADLPFHLTASCGTASRFAVVGKGGVIARGSHALSARRISTGEYSVHFDTDVSACVFTAMIGARGTTPVSVPGEISVARGAKPHNVAVATIGRSGSAANFPFHLALSCGTTPVRAVVNAAGATDRGRDVASSARIVSGQYEVIFNQNVSMCAFVASIGSAGSELSTLPLTITTATRSGNTRGAFVSIKQPDGTITDHAFHLTARC